MLRTLNHSFRIECQPPLTLTLMCAPTCAVVSYLRKCKSSILSGLPQGNNL